MVYFSNMIQVCALVTIIVLIMFFAFKGDVSYFSKLYNEILLPKLWPKVEIVEEKSMFYKMFGKDWLPIEHLLLCVSACIISFKVGWNVNNYHQLYGKQVNSKSVEDCHRKQCEIDEKIEYLVDKIEEFDRRYSLAAMELIYPKHSEEKEPPITKDAFQQVDEVGIENTIHGNHLSSTTSLEVTECIVDTCQDSNNSVSEQDNEFSSYATDGVLIKKINPELLYAEKAQVESVYIDNQPENPSLTLVKEIQNLKNEQTDSRKTMVYESDTYPIEIDAVPCSSTYSGKESHDCQSEQDKSLNICNIKENTAVTDEAEPTNFAIGSGENQEIATCKINQCRRIPHYQGMRKGTEQKSTVHKEQESSEKKMSPVSNQNKVADPITTTEMSKPLRVSTPRKYNSNSPERVETATGSRRRKQRNYNGK